MTVVFQARVRPQGVGQLSVFGHNVEFCHPQPFDEPLALGVDERDEGLEVKFDIVAEN